MLLPSFFALATVAWISLPRPRTARFLVLGTLSAWVLLSSVAMRYNGPVESSTTGIANERLFWMYYSRSRHPVTLEDYRRNPDVIEGKFLAHLAAQIPQGQYAVVGGYAQVDKQTYWIVISGGFPLRGPERVTAPFVHMGLMGVAAGDHVYLYDRYSLANPIGSHMTLKKRGRPGHEKDAAVVWMTARFVPDKTSLLPDLGTPAVVTAARQAINCEPLKAYLNGITAPLTAHQILSNMLHAVTYTRMTFSDQPTLAVGQLCS
jgi:hypothetical protein